MSILARSMSEEEKEMRIEMIDKCPDCNYARWQGDVCERCKGKKVWRKRKK